MLNRQGKQTEVTNTDAAQAGISVSLPSNASSSNGTVVVIPITVGDTTGQGIFSYDFTITFDPNVLQPATPVFDTTGTISGAAGFIITPNTGTSGQVTISGFGSQPLSGAGTLLNLRFNVVGTANTNSGTTTLTFQNFVFNEGDPQTIASDGRFTVTGATAAELNLSGRVSNSLGRGIQNVVITMTDNLGNNRIATTTAFGYYHFNNVAAGETYIISAKAKRYTFVQPTLVVNAAQDLTEINFTALP